MRLLQTSSATPRLASFADPPPYAILSHTWTSDEVSFQDIRNGIQVQKKGWSKIQFCIKQAQRDGLDYVWIDTCCIDKNSSTEIVEAINSSFSWYEGAQVCYVYIEDVKVLTEDNYAWLDPFRRSRWFTRGWTLSELLAPREVIFFSNNGKRLGSKSELMTMISDITGIPERALSGDPMSTFTIKERLKWAKNRETTRIEDEAYCLCGIFGVFMPILYGEGGKSWSRLQVEIGSDNPERPLRQTAKDSLTRRDAINPPATGQQENHQKGQDLVVKVSQIDECEDNEVQLAQEAVINPGELLPESVQTNDSVSGKKGLFKPLAKSSFRLLTIEPGNMGDAITGNIQEHDIEAPPSYHALSYVWGQDPPIHRTTINDNDHLIKPNLYHALQRVRLPYGKYSIWVDSMCINQQDSSERNQQVTQMSNIYGKASGVLIWLGEEDSTSKAALEYIANITDKQFRWTDQWWQDYRLLALSQLLQRPWFRRGWVLQEAASSTNSILLCGDQQVHMDHFVTATRTIRDRLSNIPLPPSSPLTQFHDSAAIRLIDIVTSVFKKTNDGQHRRIMLLEDLVHRTTYSEVTDQRDAIYVLLNLADDGTSYGTFGAILPDYEKPALDVMVDFLLHCCSISSQLDIICRPWAPCYSFARHGMNTSFAATRSLHKYPSWLIPKDRLAFGDPARQFHRRLHGDPLIRRGDLRCYYAHYGSRPLATFDRDIDGRCDGTLRVKGIIVGQIKDRSARMADAIISKECLDILRQGSYVPHFTHERIPDVIWRTLCADRDEKGERACHFYETAMELILQFGSKERTRIETPNLLDSFSSVDPDEILETNIPAYVEQYVRVVRDVVWNRRTIHVVGNSKPHASLVGLGPKQSQLGDHVCILYGCSIPVVLRKEPLAQHSGKDTWKLIGEAYIHGIMDGEAISSLSASSLRAAEMEFAIV